MSSTFSVGRCMSSTFSLGRCMYSTFSICSLLLMMLRIRNGSLFLNEVLLKNVKREEELAESYGVISTPKRNKLVCGGDQGSICRGGALQNVMADRLQSENLALIFPKAFKIFHLFMGVLGQEWRAWSTSSRMTCLGGSYAVLRLQTMKTLWATQLWKNVSEKCVKGTCEKFCEKKPCEKYCEKMCEKMFEKNRENRPKNLWQNSENVRKILWKKHCWDRRQNHFWVRKNISRNFSLFSGPAVCSPLLEGVGFVTHGTHFRGIVGTGACVCIHPSLPACFPDEAHLWTRVLAYFWQVLLLLVLALDWSSRGGCGRQPLTLRPFWRVSKNVKNSNLFFTPCFCRPPHDNRMKWPRKVFDFQTILETESSETHQNVPKNCTSCSVALNFYHRRFHRLQTQTQFFFTTRICRHGHIDHLSSLLVMCAQAGPAAIELVDVDASPKEVKSDWERVQATFNPLGLLPLLALFSKERKTPRSTLVAHKTPIGDIIAAIGSCSTIASRCHLSCNTPPSFTPFWLPRSGWSCSEFRGYSNTLRYLKNIRQLSYTNIYIYIYAVKLLSGPSLGFWRVIIWAKLGLVSGPSLFSHYQKRGFRRFFLLSYHFVFFCVKLFANFLKIAFFEKRVQNWVFQISLF